MQECDKDDEYRREKVIIRMSQLSKKYKNEIVPKLQKELKMKNRMAVPSVEKIVVNIGAGKALADAKFFDIVLSTLERITGQKAVKTRAKKSISNFKIRKDLPVGAMATLRGKRMYDFLDRLINIALPRVRDFRGIQKKTVDNQGNLNIGFKEHIVFPEIKSDEIDAIHGLEVSIITSTTDREKGLKLLEYLGVPFQKDKK